MEYLTTIPVLRTELAVANARADKAEKERDDELHAIGFIRTALAERDQLAADNAALRAEVVAANVRADKAEAEYFGCIEQCQRQNRQMFLCEGLVSRYAPDLEDKEYHDGVYCYGYQIVELVERLAADNARLRAALALVEHYDPSAVVCEFIDAALAATPAQSLGKIQAAALLVAANEIRQTTPWHERYRNELLGRYQGRIDCAGELGEMADRLEAGDGE